MTRKTFSTPEIEALKYYVYCLVDPRNNNIFYVGKGCGNRVFNHAENAMAEEDDSLKLNTIREIINQGLDVKYYILRHGLTEEVSFTVESAIIDLLTYPAFNRENLLTNIVSGHHQWDEGIKTSDEITQLYNCQKLELQPGHKLLMVNLNRSYNQKRATGTYVRKDIYEMTRKYWHLNKSRADQIDYLLGVYKGIVRLVIKPTTEWVLCPIDEHGNVFDTTRYAIEGVTDDAEGNRLYLNKDVTDYPFPSGGAIKYIE